MPSPKRTKALALLALGILNSPASPGAGNPCPDTRLREEWSTRCFESDASERRIKRSHRHKLHLDRQGFAAILIQESRELVVVDRRGVVVLPNVYYWGDFDYPNPDGGISRFAVRSGSGQPMCGYFEDSTFAVIVPARYDNCSSFRDGEAAACLGCIRYCTESECRNSVFLGGDSLVVHDAKGRTVRKSPALTLETVCGNGTLPTVSERDGARHLKCPRQPSPPFEPLAPPPSP